MMTDNKDFAAGLSCPEAYDRFHRLIAQEQALMNQRVGWLLVGNGLLFLAVALRLEFVALLKGSPLEMISGGPGGIAFGNTGGARAGISLGDFAVLLPVILAGFLTCRLVKIANEAGVECLKEWNAQWEAYTSARGASAADFPPLQSRPVVVRRHEDWALFNKSMSMAVGVPGALKILWLLLFVFVAFYALSPR